MTGRCPTSATSSATGCSAATRAARRRKGTLPLLEELAAAVAEWPARAVEFHRLVVRDQDVSLYGGDADAVARRARQATELGYVDVRHGGRLDLAGGPFDPFAHLPEAPRITSRRRQGRYGPPAVGLFVWRLGPYSITHAPAYCVD